MLGKSGEEAGDTYLSVNSVATPPTSRHHVHLLLLWLCVKGGAEVLAEGPCRPLLPSQAGRGLICCSMGAELNVLSGFCES